MYGAGGLCALVLLGLGRVFEVDRVFGLGRGALGVHGRAVCCSVVGCGQIGYGYSG